MRIHRKIRINKGFLTIQPPPPSPSCLLVGLSLSVPFSVPLSSRVSFIGEMMGSGMLQWAMDVVVAGVSAAVGVGIFAVVASVLCAAAFINNARDAA